MSFVEVHESSNSLYLIMELLEGGEICGFNKGKIDAESTYYIMKSILKALVYLEENGIMHRDLKPDNIILQKKDCHIKNNTVKIVDFGLATRCDIKEYLYKRCGTPGFVAPEVFNCSSENAKYTTKCDVFSTGAIFFFMLTGKVPFEGNNFD
jgi:calcium-dependent protein kinase